MQGDQHRDCPHHARHSGPPPGGEAEGHVCQVPGGELSHCSQTAGLEGNAGALPCTAGWSELSSRNSAVKIKNIFPEMFEAVATPPAKRRRLE